MTPAFLAAYAFVGILILIALVGLVGLILVWSEDRTMARKAAQYVPYWKEIDAALDAVCEQTRDMRKPR